MLPLGREALKLSISRRITGSLMLWSSMESHGVASRIHITETAHDALVSMGGYIMKPRGPMQIKVSLILAVFLLDSDTAFP